MLANLIYCQSNDTFFIYLNETNSINFMYYQKKSVERILVKVYFTIDTSKLKCSIILPEQHHCSLFWRIHVSGNLLQGPTIFSSFLLKRAPVGPAQVFYQICACSLCTCILPQMLLVLERVTLIHTKFVITFNVVDDMCTYTPPAFY